MVVLMDDNTYINKKPIKQLLQDKIDNPELKIGTVFTLADLCDPEIVNENLSHLGVIFKHLVETNQFGHIEFVEIRNDGVALYRKTEINTPFARITRVD